MKCKVCNINEAEVNPMYGVLNCKPCRAKEHSNIGRPFDFVPERIKEDRKEFKNDMTAPFRNGELSREYLDLYGTKHIDVTPEEVANAKNVWGTDLGEYYKRE